MLVRDFDRELGCTGVHFLLKKYHINLRTDFAWGKDNFTWSMGVGEAF